MSDDFDPPLGEPPRMEWVSLDQLQIDSSYQRSILAESSQKLIRDIARAWDWRLCQPLSVARRDDGSLWVMDGQHRFEGAKRRLDIPKLPCVIVPQTSRTDEAAAFVDLNKRRRALSSVDVFKARLVAGAEDAVEVDRLIRDAGLAIAPHSNYVSWKPGMLYCLPGIVAAYRRHGKIVTSSALVALSEAFNSQVLRYAGQLLRGLFMVYATEGQNAGFDADAFIERLGMNSQQQWMRKANERIAKTGEGIAKALSAVMIDAYQSHGARG